MVGDGLPTWRIVDGSVYSAHSNRNSILGTTNDTGFKWSMGHLCRLFSMRTILLNALFIYSFIVEPGYWAMCLKNLLWIRNHVVAPLSEEFTFRACMMPLLLQSFRPLAAVAITPMFFGIGHLHHIIERLRAGLPVKKILIMSGKWLQFANSRQPKIIWCYNCSGIQFCYTSIFGMYAAYLFARTGHFLAPVVAHAFCNHMGFPDVNEVLNQPKQTKHILLGTYVIGFIAWMYLLPVVTDPTWYANDLYWTKDSYDSWGAARVWFCAVSKRNFIVLTLLTLS